MIKSRTVELLIITQPRSSPCLCQNKRNSVVLGVLKGILGSGLREGRANVI